MSKIKRTFVDKTKKIRTFQEEREYRDRQIRENRKIKSSIIPASPKCPWN